MQNTVSTPRTWLEGQHARLSQRPALTAAEELRLALAWQKRRDRAALSRLVEAHLGLVVYTARGLRGYGVAQEELMAEGNLGLLRAADRFDKRGVRFRTYAAFWVRAFMLAAALRSTSIVVSATGAVGAKLFFKLRSARSRLETRLGTHQGELIEQLLARQFGLTVEQIRSHSQRLAMYDVSLDAPVGEDQDASLIDLMPAADANPEDTLIVTQRREAVRAAIASVASTLDDRERAVLEKRLLDDSGTTLAELGDDFGLSRERLRQIEAALKVRLKKALLASQVATVH